MTQHTQAPWSLTFERDPETRQLIGADVRAPDGEIVHMTGGLQRVTPADRARFIADARLIAQAPAMLAQLRGWLALFRENGHLPVMVQTARRETLAILAEVDGPDAQAEELHAVDQLAAPCPRCGAQAGERCRNYKGQAKATCPGRGQAEAPPPAQAEEQPQPGLFDQF